MQRNTIIKNTGKRNKLINILFYLLKKNNKHAMNIYYLRELLLLGSTFLYKISLVLL